MADDAQGILQLDLQIGLGSRQLAVQLVTEHPTVAIFGPSGGGKSTLLRVLAGVEKRAHGVLRVQDQCWMDTEAGVFLGPWEREVGWVPQEYLLFPHLRVRENLSFGGAGQEEVRRVAELLMVDHLLERRPRRLSGGEQQRVALGRALLAQPRILLFDEPFSALDRPLRSLVVSRLREFIRREKVLLLLVSHDESDAVALAQEHWFLSEGRLERVE